MAKKNSRTERKPLSPKPVVMQEDTAYLVREDLDEQQERLRKAAAAGAPASPTAPAEQRPSPATVPSKPLAPLAALWPDPVSPQVEASPPQGPASATAPPSPQPPAQSAPPPPQEESAVAPQALKLTAPKTLSVNFALHKPDAKRVSLCGEFNGWSPTATPMKRQDDGHWETTIALVPGLYQYKFLVDGEWLADPAALKNVPNDHGSLNSVVEVRT